VDVYIHVFLISALVGSELPASRFRCFTPRYPLDRLGGPQNRSGRRGEEKDRIPIGTGTPTPRPSSPYPVASPTALTRLPIYRYLKNLAKCITFLLSLRGLRFRRGSQWRAVNAVIHINDWWRASVRPGKWWDSASN
jgi:hypothetical protein